MTRHDEPATGKAAKRPWRAGMVLAMLATVLTVAATAGETAPGAAPNPATAPAPGTAAPATNADP